MELALIVTTVVSFVLAAAMGIIAWRLARAERARSAARVAALAADLHDVESVRDRAAAGFGGEPARFRQAARRPIDFDLGPGRASTSSGELFQTGTTDRSRSSLAAVLAVGGFAVAASLALVIVTSRGRSPLTEPSAGSTPATARTTSSAPLELVALSHERGNDRLTIRGVVRNPVGGAKIDHLTVIAYLFDREGGPIGKGGSAIDLPALGIGAQSSFAISVGQAANAGRYRVSFKIGNRVVAHVDRRKLGAVPRSDR
jgi:hypothetical protein